MSASRLVLSAGVLGRVAAGALEKIRFGIMGINGRGMAHVSALAKISGAEVVALCDVDQNRLAAAAEETAKLSGAAPKLYPDMREMLQDPGIDAITIAAPNHWHTLAAMWALEAGKHVYVEKPLSHTFEEGRRLAEAAARSGLLVQHGTQRRSDPHWIAVAEEARKGIIGEIYMARCICFQVRPPVEFAPEETPPSYLDWPLWQGPAPERPFRRNYVHYNWHWFWHYGNGEMGNNVVHFTDVAHWILRKGLPVEVFSEGRRYGKRDAGETPNTQVIINRFADGTLVVNEVRNLFSNLEGDTSTGILLYGSEGYMADGKFYNKHGRRIEHFNPPPPKDATVEHFQNFMDAIRRGRPDHVTAHPADGHVAAALCHLGSVSCRVGHSLRFDPVANQFPGDAAANALLSREYRNGFALPG